VSIAKSAVAVFLALIGSAASYAQTPAGTAGPDKASYIMVLRDPALEPPGSPAPAEREPDMARFGGRVLHSWDNRRAIELPPAAAKQLRAHPAVFLLQRVWQGEPLSEWNESGLSKAEPDGRKLAADEATDVTWTTGLYVYDPSGNIQAIGADRYGYDVAGRLVAGTVSGTAVTYGYDSFGNMTGTSRGSAAVPLPPVDPWTNRIASQPTDIAGNVLRESTRAYTYDALNMVSLVRSTVSTVRYFYTADDERIGFQTDVTGAARWRIRDFDGKVLREFAGPLYAPWEWTQDYVHAEGRLVMSSRMPENGGRRHYHLDHLGSVRLITSDTERRIATHDFLPFGVEQTFFGQEVVAGGSPYLRPDPLRYTSHERDILGSWNVESEDYIDYMHARYYTPAGGRFLSVDPLLDVKRSTREPQSWNRYSYVVNNPINRIDPDGRMDGNGMGEPVQWRCPGCTRAEALEQSNEIAAGTAKGAAWSLGGMAAGAGVYAFATNATFRLSVLMNLTGMGIGMTAGVSVPMFRGGQNMMAAAKDVRIKDGLVQTTHGVSVNAVASDVQKFGGAYRVTSIPDGLKVIQRGTKNQNHYEIVPVKPMTMEDYQKLLSQVKLEPVK
jgi:RHS repeat-associated protein